MTDVGRPLIGSDREDFVFHGRYQRTSVTSTEAAPGLVFGPSEEASARLSHFVEEASRWEDQPLPGISAMADDVDLTEVGKFQFLRQGRVIHMDVAIDGRRYR